MEPRSEAVWLENLPEALREALGLSADERLRLLERSPSALVLERVGLAGGTFPGRGAADLRVNVATLPLSDVLGAIHAAGRSGFLCFRYRDHEKSVYLHRGEVVFATSNQRVDRLGECLLRAGVINLDQLREAERRFTPPERFGKVLVERGFLTPRELWNGVKYQVEEIVRSLFAYPGGSVGFWDGEVQPDNVVRLSLETGRLVSEGLQRSKELAKFLSVLEDPRVRLAAAEGFDAHLAGNERAITDAVGTERSFPEVCAVLGFDRESAARSVQLLRLVGAVKLTRQAGAAPGVPDEEDLRGPDPHGLREHVSSMTKLVAELVAAVAAADGGGEGIRQRLERVLDDATGRFPALLTGVTLTEGAGLDPDVLVERALKLPGDREGQLTGALGELVAYLEFEIKNHPQVAEPDALLASFREPRATLG